MPKTDNTRRNSRAYHDPDYEGRIQAAIEGKRTQKYKSWADAAKQEDVKYSTLLERAKGLHASYKEVAVKRQLLPPESEQVLLDWMEQAAASGTPFDHRALRNYASDIAEIRAGKCWSRRFVKRHLQVLAAKSRKLDPKRAQNFNEAVVADFFAKLKSVTERYGDIPPEHIYNMDEKGIQMGGGRKNNPRKYMYLRSTRNRYRISSDNLELVTVIECISAAGLSLPPSFVLSDGPLPNLSKLPDNSVSSVGLSPSGWTDNELTEHWIRWAFIPFVLRNRVDETKPILLIYDGHDSHETPELKQHIYSVADTCDIIILCFPSKCTHKMQPLDVAVFAQCANGWREHCDDCLYSGIIINRYNVIQNYLKVREKYMSVNLIKSAFKKTGIYPINPDIFTKEDYGPSKASSTIAWTPDSFPEDVPSSDPTHLSDIESDYEDNNYPDVSDSEDDVDDGDDEPLGLANDDTDNEADSTEAGTNFTPLEPVHQTRSSHNTSSAKELITECYRDMATWQYKTDESKSPDELLDEVVALRKHINTLCNTLQIQESLTNAANAHCTIVKRQFSHLQTQLENTRKQKSRGSTKVKARFLTLPELKTAFEKEEAEQAERQRVATEKEEKREAEKQEREKRIQKNAQTKVFDLPLSSYKLKDDLRTLALALGISDKGKSATLEKDISSYLEANRQELEQNPRFSGLFGTGKCRRARLPTSSQPSSDISSTSHVARPTPHYYHPTYASSSNTYPIQHYTSPSTTTHHFLHPGLLVQSIPSFPVPSIPSYPSNSENYPHSLQ